MFGSGEESSPDRSRSPRVKPIVQEMGWEYSTCALCPHNSLQEAHNHDWDLWLTLGADDAAIMGRMRFLGLFVRWTSVFRSTYGVSVPICHACRASVYRHLNQIAFMTHQADCLAFPDPLTDLHHAKHDVFVAWKTVACHMAGQVRSKMLRIKIKNAIAPGLTAPI